MHLTTPALLTLLLCGFGSMAGPLSAQTAGRRIIPLDGAWQIQANDGAAMPEQFPHTIPVPGVVKLAKPGWDRQLSPLGYGHEDVWGQFRSLPADERRAAQSKARQEGKAMGFAAYWYRRTVRIDGAVPTVARLIVNKARWGVTAWVNGIEVGSHDHIRTAGIFEVAQALQGDGADNEIVLRIVGKWHLTKDKAIPTAARWSGKMPGIYDSVSLILSDTPHLLRVQAAPNVTDSSVRLVGALHNTSDTARTVAVDAEIREVRGDGHFALTTPLERTIGPGTEASFDVTIPMPGAKLWSPSSPQLYTFTVTVTDTERDIPTDALSDRFGMRSFRIDPETGEARLNGRHVFLRGAGVLNVTDVMEHPDLTDHVWRDAWIRRALQNIKDINGNAVRSAFDFMPKRWYEIADEMGIMIQDEAMSGPPGRAGSESLARWFAEWIHERANHPSVIIWDATNEHIDTRGVLHRAIASVRQLDLSGRPWDCSFSPTGVPGDVSYEKHPYRGWSSKYSIHDIGELYAQKVLYPDRLHREDVEKVPLEPGYIINEFCGVFLRSGARLSFKKSMFLTRMDPDAPPEDRYVVRGRYHAAEYEVLRRKSGCIGVLWNPYLHGSDRHVVDDLSIPRIEPHFFRFMKDASAPVGVMVAFFEETAQPGRSLRLPIAITNDALDPWQGDIRVAILAGERNLLTTGVLLLPPETDGAIADRTLAEWTIPGHADVGERIDFPVEITIPSEPGLYHLMAEIKGADDEIVRSWREFAVQ